MAPGIGARLWSPTYRAGPETGVVQMIVPEADKLGGIEFQLQTVKNNLACRIFGRSNIATPLDIVVTWDAIVMERVIFHGEPGIGNPFAGTWVLLGQPPRKAKMVIGGINKTDAGCAAIRAGSLGGQADLISTDFESGLAIEYPMAEGNLLLVTGGCLNVAGHPIYALDRCLTEQWAARIDPKQGTVGAAAYFGSAFSPSPTDTFTLMPSTPQQGILVAAEWSGVPAV
jgi:hypothetical protein